MISTKSFSHPFGWSPAPFTVFQDQLIADHINEYGYKVVDFIEQDAIRELNEIFESEHSFSGENGGMFYSVYSQNFEYRRRIHAKISAILKPSFENLFKDYENIINFFINKIPGEGSAFAIHQDSSVVDEFKYSTLSIWIPLQDVDRNNGALWFVEKSQRMFSPYRGVSFQPPFHKIKDTIKDYMKPVPLKAGQALLFDGRTLHTSGSNNSNAERRAIVSGIMPKGFEFRISYQETPESDIEMYAQEKGFMLEYPNFYFGCTDRPTIGQKIENGEFIMSDVTAEEFVQNCQVLGVRKVNEFSEEDGKSHFFTEPFEELAVEQSLLKRMLAKLGMKV